MTTPLDDRYPDAIEPVLTAENGVKRAYQLMIETADVVQESVYAYEVAREHDDEGLSAKWRAWMRERMKAKLLCANTTLTGRPGRYIYVWYVDWGFSLAEMQAALHEDARRQDWIGEMFRALNGVSYDVLVPTSYDPGRCWRAPGAPQRCSCPDAPKLASPAPCIKEVPSPIDTNGPERCVARLIDVIDVKPGRLADLADKKGHCFVENAKQRFGITLVASGTRVAEARKLVQVWNLPEHDSLRNAATAFMDDGWYPDMLSNDVRSEQQELLLPWDHDPRPTSKDNCWQYG